MVSNVFYFHPYHGRGVSVWFWCEWINGNACVKQAGGNGRWVKPDAVKQHLANFKQYPNSGPKTVIQEPIYNQDVAPSCMKHDYRFWTCWIFLAKKSFGNGSPVVGFLNLHRSISVRQYCSSPTSTTLVLLTGGHTNVWCRVSVVIKAMRQRNITDNTWILAFQEGKTNQKNPPLTSS